jgi:hypothetical protein
MNKSKLVLVTAIIFLGGCSMQPIIKKVNESKSGFDGAFYQGETEIISNDLSNNEQYRIYEKGATGFVPVDAIMNDTEQRAKAFCSEKNKVMKKLKVQTFGYGFPGKPGDFPRAEITFVCIDKPNDTVPSTFNNVLYTRLNNLKKLLDNSVITKEEFEKEKAKILNP